MPSSPTSTRRNGSAARSPARRKPQSGAQQDESDAGAQITERVGDWVEERVDERPWTMVGAAAGVGLVMGALSRPAQSTNLGRMLSATASGVAVRLAISTLVDWLGGQTPSAESETPRPVH